MTTAHSTYSSAVFFILTLLTLPLMVLLVACLVTEPLLTAGATLQLLPALMLGGIVGWLFLFYRTTSGVLGRLDEEQMYTHWKRQRLLNTCLSSMIFLIALVFPLFNHMISTMFWRGIAEAVVVVWFLVLAGVASLAVRGIEAKRRALSEMIDVLN